MTNERHGPTWLLVAAIGLLMLPLLGADKCSISWPQPQPTPTATPEPTPEPTPPPTTCVPPCSDGERCVPLETFPVQYECIPTPEPTPVPTPTAPPVASCGVRLDGQPRMDINFHASNRNIDATPKIYNADRCTAVGFVNRQTCPVTPEGDDRRGPCECELMTGTATEKCSPVWEMQNATGTLRIELEDGWMGRLYGTGSGQVRACYPNGNACSAWLEVSL